MYNRYIPQPDGSYRRNRIPEPAAPEPMRRPMPQKTYAPPPPEPPPSIPPKPHKPHKAPPRKEPESIGSFFKQLLPQDLDTGDLLIILLLLLMAGDCKEDKNSALLTLALYFFM